MAIDINSSDKEILDHEMAGTTVRGLGAMSFMAWVINKVNGLETYKAATQELIALAKNPPLGQIPEAEKIKMVRKLMEAGAKI
jgi:hypothetical protein